MKPKAIIEYKRKELHDMLACREDWFAAIFDCMEMLADEIEKLHKPKQ